LTVMHKMRGLIAIIAVVLTSSFQQGSESFILEVSGLRSTQGVLRISLYNQEKGFPENPKAAFRTYTVPVSGARTAVNMGVLPPGRYAIALMHDENNNKKMDKNKLGIPREGFGFSNNPKIRFSAPSFEKAGFEVKPGKKGIAIQLTYF
ncbi:MAG: DUF2141 domain-containing protein, partial [Sphingobacteriales bacterium]